MVALAWPLLRPLIVTSLIQRADLYLVFGKTQQARTYLARAQALDPNNPDMLDTAALSHDGDPLPKLRIARNDLIGKAELEPNNGSLWLNLAIMDARLHHYHDARREIDVAARTLHDRTTLELQHVLHDRS